MELCEAFSIGEFSEIVRFDWDYDSTIETFNTVDELSNIIHKFKTRIMQDNIDMFLTKYNNVLSNKISSNNLSTSKYITFQWINIQETNFSNLISLLFMIICGSTIDQNILDNLLLIQFKKTGPTKKSIYVIKLWLIDYNYENILQTFNDILKKYNVYFPECYNGLKNYILNFNKIMNNCKSIIEYDKLIYYLSYRKFNMLKNNIGDKNISSNIENILDEMKNDYFIVTGKH